MAGAEEHVAKRCHLKYARPGSAIGDGQNQEYNIGALPIQPLYEAVKMTNSELTDLLNKMNLGTILRQQMQCATDVVYRLQIPQQITEEWVREHVHKVYQDNEEALKNLFASLEN